MSAATDQSEVRAILTDTTRCTGCEECVAACKRTYHLPRDRAWRWQNRVDDLSASRFTTIIRRPGSHYVRHQCRHCLEPACVSACIVGALQKTDLGPVIYDSHRCMGCRYCMVACPFDVPKYEWESNNPKVRKCVFCYARQREGKPPACAEACPAEATVYGDREELLKLAQERFEENPDQYTGKIFGETVVGGTTMLFIGDLTPKQMGFPDNLPDTPLRELTRTVLSKIPGAVVIAGSFLLGMSWLTKRKNEIAAQNAAHKDEER